MKNIIIGTAGHVDHGKTCLIKAMTGIDTDRLEEEKKRGITIELGFAYLDLPDGEKVGIIDVPGHERFIKNMLAGAGGMDMVLLVVAADEGIMPQTREHLNILSMLDIKSGVVVLTKSDLVEEDWMEFVIDEVRNELESTFLKDAPVIPVSSHTGAGIERLKQEIFRIIEKVQPKSMVKSFRMPVDRVFSVSGFGTVVTGTLIEGTVSAGDPVTVYPAGHTSKVRNLQVHGQNVKTAWAGQRVAVNLAAFKKDEVMRGDTLAEPDSMEQTMMLDVKLNSFADTTRLIENGSILHFYHGTRNILCKAILLDKDNLKAGEGCYVQLRLNEFLAVKSGDRFIVRFYSPVETLGGGEILEANPIKHRRNQPSVIESLRIKEKGSLTEKVLQAVIEYSPRFADMGYISKRLTIDVDELQEELSKISDQSSLVRINDKIVVHSGFMLQLRCRLVDILSEYHAKNPLLSGMRQDELKHRLLPDCEPQISDAVIELFAREKVLRLDQQKAALYSFSISINESQQKLMQDIEKKYLDAGYSMPPLDELQEKYPNSRSAFKQVVQSMLDGKTLINITAQMYLHKDYFISALEAMESLQNENGVIALGEFRDRLATSRKYALPILEYCDNKNITQKSGDLRKIIIHNLQRQKELLSMP